MTTEFSKAFDLAGLVSQAPESIVSRAVVKNPAGNVTLFAFAKGQELSPHTAPYDAMICVLDGRASVMIGDTWQNVGRGEAIVMPANIPHAVKAEDAFKMMLVMIKG